MDILRRNTGQPILRVLVQRSKNQVKSQSPPAAGADPDAVSPIGILAAAVAIIETPIKVAREDGMSGL